MRCTVLLIMRIWLLCPGLKLNCLSLKEVHRRRNIQMLIIRTMSSVQVANVFIMGQTVPDIVIIR